MKNRKLFYALILSLAFNLAFLGALGYRLWERREHRAAPPHRLYRHKRFLEKHIKLPPEKMEKLERIHESFYPRIRPIRIQLVHERRELGDLLMEEKPDTLLIEERLERIGELQTKIEREVVYQLLREKDILDKEERERFLNIVVRRLGRKLGPPMGLPRKSDSLKCFEEFQHKNKKEKGE